MNLLKQPPGEIQIFFGMVPKDEKFRNVMYYFVYIFFKQQDLKNASVTRSQNTFEFKYPLSSPCVSHTDPEFQILFEKF